MADLTTDCAGIKRPNPFWLASAPPANTGEQVMRAFDAGWGGPETLIVVSTDLSHYLDYAACQATDQRTADAQAPDILLELHLGQVELAPDQLSHVLDGQ